MTPLQKSGSVNDISSYRPISLPSETSLAVERLSFDYVYSNISPVIQRQQFGFLKQRDTITQFNSVPYKVYSNFDANTTWFSDYFDVEKAFDSVPHLLKLSKLHDSGFDKDFIQMFQSCLNGRT